MVPHSRHTTVDIEDVKKVKELKILSTSKEAGLYAVSSKNGKQIFITGHSEYDADTLMNEYLRDVSQGLPIEVPKNYYKDDNYENKPLLTWRSHANNLYTNWINYYVYQATPYVLEDDE